MPLGPLEAAGVGLPILLSGIPGHSVLKDFGRLYSLSSPKEGASRLVESCQELSADEGALRQRLWERAKPLREQYSIEAMAGKYEALYNSSTYA